jgi:hypothetical protein
MGWGGFYPWAGGIGVPAAFQLGVQSEISKFLADPNATYNYVLEGTVYRSASEDVGFPDAWGAFPWGFGGSSIDNGIYYAWDTLNTESTDTPPNKHMPGLLTVPINYEVSAPITGTGGGASSGFGGSLCRTSRTTLPQHGAAARFVYAWAGRMESAAGPRRSIMRIGLTPLPFAPATSNITRIMRAC